MVYIILVLLGLCFGSFVNAVVWRIHEQEKPGKKSKAKQKQISITQGRSVCPNCRHQLAWYDLIPVMSWLSLKGKCRYCHKPISRQYPLVELTTLAAFVISYFYWPVSLHGGEWFNFICWLVLLTGLTALLVYDLKWMILPNRIVYPLLVLVTVQQLVNVIFLHGGLSTLIAALWGLVVGGGLFYVLFQVSQGKWIGGGDVKLGAVLGITVGGPGNSLLMLFIASVLGSLYALPLLALKKTKASSRIPFGPFLIIAAVITYLFGASILAWYQRLFLNA